MNDSIISSLRHFVFKALITFMLALVFGIALGVGTARAEAYSNVWAGNWFGATGNVGAYACSPLPPAMQLGGIGSTSETYASLNAYWLRAAARIWHIGNIKQAESIKTCNNCSGKATICIYSSGDNDKLTNQSVFQDRQNYPLFFYYTSVPDNSASCYQHWNSGITC